MRTGKQLTLISILLALIFVFSAVPAYSIAIDSKVSGVISHTGVLRDTDGFQYGFLDENDWVQFRTELQFDAVLTPQYMYNENFKVEKVFFRYRGAYDAVYERDRYSGIPDERDGTWNLGLRDVIYENDLRESFADLSYTSDSGWYTNFRPGRQIIQWGEAGLFNVVNVVNPQDLSSKRSFANPDDLAMPVWMSRLDISSPAVGVFNELALQYLYIPDNRPTIFGPDTLMGSSAYSAAPGLNVLQNHESFALNNAQHGVRVGATSGSLKTYFYYFNGFENGPALNFSQIGTGTLIFDHPRISTYGASFNYDFDQFILRGEGLYSEDTYKIDFTQPLGYAAFDRYEALIGFDTSFFKQGFPGAGGSVLNSSFELWYRHMPDYDFDAALRPSAKEDQYRATFVFSTFFLNGSLLPVVAGIYDFSGDGVFLTAVSLDYTPDGKKFIKLSSSATFGDKDATESDFAPLIGSSELALQVGYRF